MLLHSAIDSLEEHEAVSKRTIHHCRQLRHSWTHKPSLQEMCNILVVLSFLYLFCATACIGIRFIALLLWILLRSAISILLNLRFIIHCLIPELLSNPSKEKKYIHLPFICSNIYELTTKPFKRIDKTRLQMSYPVCVHY